MSDAIHLSSKAVLDREVLNLSETAHDGSYELILRKIPKSRTSIQNRALHLLFKLVAVKLNEAGYSFWSAMLRKPAATIIELRDYKNNSRSADFFDGVAFACYELESSLPNSGAEWTPDLVKAHLWRPIQLSATGKSGTSKCNVEEYPLVYTEFSRCIGSAFGIEQQWPNKDMLKIGVDS